MWSCTTPGTSRLLCQLAAPLPGLRPDCDSSPQAADVDQRPAQRSSYWQIEVAKLTQGLCQVTGAGNQGTSGPASCTA
jgi:hypothetical protein